MKHWNVAAYIRLSKEDGDNLESNSITNQKDIIKQFVDNCPDMTVAEFYIDSDSFRFWTSLIQMKMKTLWMIIQYQ